MAPIKLKNFLIEDRAIKNKKIYDAATLILNDLLDSGGYVSWAVKNTRWRRGDYSYHYEAPIRIEFEGKTNFQQAQVKLKDYIKDEIDNTKIYYFPKYKVYGRFRAWFGNKNEWYLEIFGRKMYQNLKYDLEKGKIR